MKIETLELGIIKVLSSNFQKAMKYRNFFCHEKKQPHLELRVCKRAFFFNWASYIICFILKLIDRATEQKNRERQKFYLVV